MTSTCLAGRSVLIALVAAWFCALIAGSSQAHCDTMNGPLIPEALAALDKGDVTPVLKWVKQEKEPEIELAFQQALAERSKSPAGKKLADTRFLETVVRIHREGEGASFTGIKDELVEPIVAMADKALAAGSADEMIRKISAHMASAIKSKFDKVTEAAKHKDNSTLEGREFVAAYVAYMHYVEGVHAAITAAGPHHDE
jgi:hypothetical protein